MSAFNRISFYQNCPNCGEFARIEAQCHTASSFERDDVGRLCGSAYQIGERMRWWREDDARWRPWADLGDSHREDGPIRECCYAICGHCGANLYSIIEFKNVTPVGVVDLGMEKNWPDDYRR